MTITRNDLALFIAALAGAWIGVAHYEGAVAVTYWAFAILFSIAAFAVKQDA